MSKFKVYKHTQDTWVVMNKCLQYDTGYNIHSGEFKTLEDANKFCKWINHNVAKWCHHCKNTGQVYDSSFGNFVPCETENDCAIYEEDEE